MNELGNSNDDDRDLLLEDQIEGNGIPQREVGFDLAAVWVVLAFVLATGASHGASRSAPAIKIDAPGQDQPAATGKGFADTTRDPLCQFWVQQDGHVKVIHGKSARTCPPLPHGEAKLRDCLRSMLEGSLSPGAEIHGWIEPLTPWKQVEDVLYIVRHEVGPIATIRLGKATAER